MSDLTLSEQEELELAEAEADADSSTVAPVETPAKVFQGDALKTELARQKEVSDYRQNKQLSADSLNVLSGLSPYAPQILGAIKGYGVGVNAVPAYLKGKLGLGPEAPSPLDVDADEYEKTRDFYKAELADAEAAGDKTFGISTGKLVGGMMLPGPAGKTAFLPKVAQAGLMGAYQTGATDASGLGVGGGVGAGATGLFHGTGKLVGAVGEGLSRRAALSAFGNPTTSALKKAGAVSPAQISALGAELRDSGLIKPFGTAGDVAELITEKLGVDGEELAAVIAKIDADAVKAGNKFDMAGFGSKMRNSLIPAEPSALADEMAAPVRKAIDLGVGSPPSPGKAGFSQGVQIFREMVDKSTKKEAADWAPQLKKAYGAGREFINDEAARVAGPEAKTELEAVNKGYSQLKKMEGLNKITGSGSEFPLPGVLKALPIPKAVSQRIPSTIMKPAKWLGNAGTEFAEAELPATAARAAYAASAGKPQAERDDEAIAAFTSQSP